MGLHSSLVKARRHGSSAAGMKKVCAVLLVVSMTLAWTATPSTTTTTSAGTFFAVSAASDKVESADPEETCVVGADGTQECFPAVPVEETDTDSEDETEAEEVDDEEVEQPLLDENGEPQVAPALEDIDDCTDQNASCAFWATEGECQANPSYMLTQCAYSCQSCDTTATENHGHTRLYGKRQRGQDPATLQKVAEMHRYMTEVVFVNETYAKVKNDVSYAAVATAVATAVAKD